MTNTLRSRIAAALQYADRRMALEDEMPVGAYYASLADAVIRELDTALDVAVTYLSVDKLRREFCVEGQEGIRPMSDTLRTRIAAVLGANSHMSRELQDHLADAVIEALRLHRNDEEDEYGGYKPTGRYRYVTEWETE